MGLKGRMKANVCAGGRGEVTSNCFPPSGTLASQEGRLHRKGKAIRLQDLVLEVPHRIVEYHGEMGRDYDT